MSLFVDICSSTQSFLGTGRVNCKDFGKDAQIFRTNADFEFDDTSAVKLKAQWDAGILAGNIQPLGKVSEIEAQDVAATFYEAPVNNLRQKLTDAKRITQYRFVQSLCNHAALESYDGVNCRFFALTDAGVLRGTRSSDGKVKGFLSSQFDVGIMDTRTDAAVAYSRLTIAWDDYKEWDSRGVAIEPSFDMNLLEGPYNVGFMLDSVTTGATLTLVVDAFGSCGASQVTDLVQADFTLVDGAGAAIAIDSVTNVSNKYTVTATTAETSGVLSLNGIIDKTTKLYSSNGISFG